MTLVKSVCFRGKKKPPKLIYMKKNPNNSTQEKISKEE